MKYFLVWKDGRREATECGGGIKIICPHRVDGRMHETVFELREREDGDVWLYHEAESKDVNARYRESDARRRNAEDQARGFRMPMFELELRGRFPEETDEEFERRIALRQGHLP